jgi:hypothetical protein
LNKDDLIIVFEELFGSERTKASDANLIEDAEDFKQFKIMNDPIEDLIRESQIYHSKTKSSIGGIQQRAYLSAVTSNA